MNLEEFETTLIQQNPPAGITPILQALWYDAKGDWNRAHRIVQEISGPAAAWVHAYLHRKEGDTWNADYWYSRAGHQRPQLSLESEWHNIVAVMLNQETE